MRRTMELALKGIGFVSTNPLVGCVIVHDGKIISESWHKKFGGPHAEVNAIAGLPDKSILTESTLYVNLEPCAHFGKTPPCADMLIEHKVKRVVVANLDSNPLVAGEGISRMRNAGIEVTTGILEEEGRKLNRRFFTYFEKLRPYVILKWAETADGFIARENFESKWISGELSRQLVHKWRSEEDAVLVGTRTALHDNPRLNVRDWSGRDPVRVVIDRNLVLDNNSSLFDGTQKTLCYTLSDGSPLNNTEVIKLDQEGFLENLLSDLYNHSIQSVMVEGGGYTLQKFFETGLWDEVRQFVSREKFGKGIDAPAFNGVLEHEEQIGDDLLRTYFPRIK